MNLCSLFLLNVPAFSCAGLHTCLQHLGTFHQCVKRELPYEAMHVYQKIKEAQPGKLDLALCNGLLNVAVGKDSKAVVGSRKLLQTADAQPRWHV